MKLTRKQISELTGASIHRVKGWLSNRYNMPEDCFDKVMRAEKALEEIKNEERN